MKNSKADAERWLRQAENDLEAAKALLREGFFSQACFAAQQVGEKALKALVFNRGDRFAVGHSLQQLLADLDASYPELSGLGNIARVLDQYYIATRYPDALPGGTPFETFVEEQARTAVADAGKVVDTARGLIQA